MQLLSHTQETQSVDALRHESTASRPAYKPQMAMIWITESIGDRTRLFARWTTQD
ncbi:hypothetical protein H6F76_21905 [Leptolyngbya sp. FACHB-321]|uniref:hypothetical protein n=1 Tax=Leptolyngbya sp. FACHB-321 TaxID=2692807 RepID=UPI00168615B0|nr:hypothetical protein [Leptolyngbya sp. FACHB-321]MBD2037620.1 hypothetical protein [Leptolyngbya sp. FACHB-321]